MTWYAVTPSDLVYIVEGTVCWMLLRSESSGVPPCHGLRCERRVVRQLQSCVSILSALAPSGHELRRHGGARAYGTALMCGPSLTEMSQGKSLSCFFAILWMWWTQKCKGIIVALSRPLLLKHLHLHVFVLFLMYSPGPALGNSPFYFRDLESRVALGSGNTHTPLGIEGRAHAPCMS